jgi:hypothetical protein
MEAERLCPFGTISTRLLWLLASSLARRGSWYHDCGGFGWKVYICCSGLPFPFARLFCTGGALALGSSSVGSSTGLFFLRRLNDLYHDCALSFRLGILNMSFFFELVALLGGVWVYIV